MFIEIILLVVTFVNIDVSAAQTDAYLPSLCCITGDGRNYKINTSFITVDCKSRCVCTQDAYLGCIPLCPQTIQVCPTGFKLHKLRESFKNKNKVCLCSKYKCLPISSTASSNTNYCSEGNKLYKPGEEFFRNCNERCRCQNGGQVRCVSLCPNVKPCMVDHTEKDVLVPIPYNKCQCTTKACKPLPYTGKCIVNGQTYKSGDTFVSTDCSSKCSCNPGGQILCGPLCTPPGNSCKLNEQAVQVQLKVLNSTCTCPAVKCVKNNQVVSVVGQIVNPNVAQVKKQPVITMHQCKTSIKGKIYPIGTVFSDNNCTSKCHCLNGGVLSCQALCLPVPPPDSSCKKQITVQRPTGLPDAQGNSCSCTTVTCSN